MGMRSRLKAKWLKMLSTGKSLIFSKSSSFWDVRFVVATIHHIIQRETLFRSLLFCPVPMFPPFQPYFTFLYFTSYLLMWARKNIMNYIVWHFEFRRKVRFITIDPMEFEFHINFTWHFYPVFSHKKCLSPIKVVFKLFTSERW